MEQDVRSEPMVIHAAWTGQRLHLWGETLRGPASGDELSALIPWAAPLGEPGRIRLRLPFEDGRHVLSPELALLSGRDRGGLDIELLETEAEAVSIEPGAIPRTIERLEDGEGGVVTGDAVRYFALAARFARHLLAHQRFVPMARQDGSGTLLGAWRGWVGDEASGKRAAELVRATPPVVRAVVDESEHDAWVILESFIGALIDHACRETLRREEMIDTIDGQDPDEDPQVAWLAGLLEEKDPILSPPPQRTEFSRRVRRWIGALEERGQSSDWRLCLTIHPPLDESLDDDMDEGLDSLQWSVSFSLQSQEDPGVRIEAADLWGESRERVTVEGYALEQPQELLLAELARAARFEKGFERALSESEPIEVMLKTSEAHRFMRETKPVLVEQGFGVITPTWWDAPEARLGVRLKIDSGELNEDDDTGLSSLVGYHWEIAIGETTLSLHEFERFASRPTPLARVGGAWVEIRPEDVRSAVGFIKENPGGEMALVEAMRLAYATDQSQTGVPVVGLDATGWAANILGGSDESASVTLPTLVTPETFHGSLRPYQERGLSWLWFIERFGMGACLADDMGLGKTIQLLALMAHEREEAEREGEALDPTLLVAPMSVIGNWSHETRRFVPTLKWMIHHGMERAQGEAFVRKAEDSDLVITTYALAHRDREMLEKVRWRRVVLDEAQFVKNPASKQSVAVRSLPATRRIALTGTPVENRLSELWSIMDFLNPGYLGSMGDFRKRFATPIERYHDRERAERLRALVRPFILRRLKTDPRVVADLPEKLEHKQYTHLTPEQAELYEACVKRMLTDVDRSEGIQRRGVVLAALIRLKQICNHPSQVLKDVDFKNGPAPDPSRSGKCVRLLEQLEEALSEGDKALVFTQFREMGRLLSPMLRRELGRDVMFLHGGTPQATREKMIQKFQSGDPDAPILMLSLKAGGVGLNLTAATHVFHFDRWWNPAVENQATDRAYRIGQTRTVQVHKYIVRGTLEERIDEMIESKIELAENIIGAGERWLTELDTSQLRDILTLRQDAVGV